MRDERDGLQNGQPNRSASSGVAGLEGAVIIPFPRRSALTDGRMQRAVSDQHVGAAIDAVVLGMASRSAAHSPTVLAALGGLSGFAIQQMLLREGGVAWSQPRRAEHLDRLLLSEKVADASLWLQLRDAAHALGAHHLPDPNTLLQATLRCVGTTQFGLVTLPLEYKLLQQPQGMVADLWTGVSRALTDEGVSSAALTQVLIAACSRRVAKDSRIVPPHVALRILMQSALAMALIEPRVIPGATLKAQAN